ncbi:MAG: hypothetical protein GC159_21615 [Phycisphaera sp.]|nr:hypothetical protein [Phycisphaera sp.]
MTGDTTTSQTVEHARQRWWRRGRRRWIVLAVVGLVACAALGAGVVIETRHRRVRQIEMLYDRHAGIYVNWRWSVDSDPGVYGRCVDLEYGLYDWGDRHPGLGDSVAMFLSRNIERCRRRLRSNLSPINEATTLGYTDDFFMDDAGFAVMMDAIRLTHERGCDTFRVFVYDDEKLSAARADADSLVARRMREAETLAHDLGVTLEWR